MAATTYIHAMLGLVMFIMLMGDSNASYGNFKVNSTVNEDGTCQCTVVASDDTCSSSSSPSTPGSCQRDENLHKEYDDLLAQAAILKSRLEIVRRYPPTRCSSGPSQGTCIISYNI